MYWNGSDELKCQVHLKPNQKLKYLNSDSTHLSSVFKAIPSGVLERLGKLTSKSKKIENTKIEQIYPLHSQALKTAGLAPKRISNLPPTRKSPKPKNYQRERDRKETEEEEKESANLLLHRCKHNFVKNEQTFSILRNHHKTA